MTSFEEIPANVRTQYEALYGTYAPVGEYVPGDEISAPGASGEVLWRYQSAHGLVYVIGGWRAFPVEVAANEVVG